MLRITFEHLGTEGDGLKTGIELKAKTDDKTKAMFFDLKRRAASDIKTATFLVDLIGENEIIDTFSIDDVTFETMTGQAPKSRAEYQKIDGEYWTSAFNARS